MKANLINKINKLKEEQNAIILAHNYQINEVQAIADYTGDSLGLSRTAAQTDAEVIVFAGVDFMAESAAILAPHKKVLLPERNAACPMAEMITVKELRKKKKQYPKAAVVCYVNSSAAVKAESDICCTSSNAVEIVEAIDKEQILFVPDQNLGQYVADRTTKEVILWDGYCRTHHRVRPKDITEVKNAHPQVKIIVHPECKPEVVKLADYVGSTAQILEFAKESNDEKIIVGTEMGILYNLKQNNPDKDFYLLTKALICQNMKMTSLKDIVCALEEMKYQITVDDEIRLKAQSALDKMLELSN
ncbi:quinolinate synthetase complex, A subunit [Halobacteroides halobius DSM 5150]|uniref:Quinolinate synthase n=1 Tax=Halobacteroides halobius (strain ATCC 35273 / DSM 5150 / MD-1) TaxID=748449 RepID=L0K9Q0_HALHC|nr:quinolinate synthase NadA [Halobacteroides halobius]AGB41099.1 quinolinate synthetase complex, A subunit [Halobacteroides halobius DSM 5150]